MKKIIRSRNFYIPVLLLLCLIPLLYDIFSFYSKVYIVLFNYISELLTIAFAAIYYFILKEKVNYHKKSVQENLRSFIQLLGLFYLSLIISKIMLKPNFSQGMPQTVSTVLYSNLVAILGFAFLTPKFLIINMLIFYKRTKSTYFFMRLFLLLSAACIISSGLVQASPHFKFTGAGILPNIILILVFVPVFFLSFRNSWITFLSRREKLVYFFISLLIIWALIYLLLGFSFVDALPVYNYTMSAYLSILWFILIGYTGFSALYLLLQLPTARAFDRKMREVNSLHNLGRTINSEFDFDKLVKLITDMTSEVIGSESNWLEVYNEESQQLYIAAAHNLLPHELENKNEKKQRIIRDEIINTQKPIFINEISKTPVYRPLKEWKPDIESLVGVPLISSKGNIMGILFASKSRMFGFDLDDLAMLEAYANQAVIALENASLLHKSLERERLEQELKIAREAQQRLLPRIMPRLKNITIEALTVMAHEVGGDYYDFIDLPDNRLGIIIGDVSGKGTSAAFYMAECKGSIQSLSKTFFDPKSLLVKTNEIIYESFDRKSFITLLMASLSTKKKQLTFARAGHCPLIYCNAQTKHIKLLKPNGIGVGLESGEVFTKNLEEMTVNYGPGDLFVFFTDGISEARNSEHLEFGEEKLCQIIKDNIEKDVNELKEIIIETVLTFSEGQTLGDDLTLLIVKT
jgi:sigma-B regulation protein RsbU (phosphoserine phosphatase)